MSTSMPANALYKAGLTFGVEGERLWVSPAANMTPELVALVRDNKENLIRVARFRELADSYKSDREGTPPTGPRLSGTLSKSSRWPAPSLTPRGLITAPPRSGQPHQDATR